MLTQISTLLSQKMISEKAISEEEIEIYIYGFELLLSFLFSTSVVLLIGVITGNFLLTVIFLIVFIFTRKFTGGFHATSYAKCQICTISIYLFVLIGSKLIYPNLIIYAVLGITGYITILLFAPVWNPHKPLSKREIKKFKILSIIFFTIMLMGGIILFPLHPILSNTIFLSLAAVIVLIILPSIKERRQKT